MEYKNITNFDDLIELEHGKLGTESRNNKNTPSKYGCRRMNE